MLTLPVPVVDVVWLRDHLGDPALRVADGRFLAPDGGRLDQGSLSHSSSGPARPAATGPKP